jgi:hypothetical protein
MYAKGYMDEDTLVSAMHLAVIVPGLVALSLLDAPPPAWVRWCLRLVALFAVVKHLPRVLLTRPSP